jgi:hypothetical protein
MVVMMGDGLIWREGKARVSEPRAKISRHNGIWIFPPTQQANPAQETNDLSHHALFIWSSSS